MPEFSLPKTEEKILDFWRANNIIEKSLARKRKRKRFIFYEGPPTANGLPHIGHFLTRIFKDLFARFKTMEGFDVARKAGWDTHGLPVEIEIEKELGLKSKAEIEKYGIGKFNKKAKKSVLRYQNEWERFSKRIGFWLDFDNPYITYETDYIESLWWIIQQFDKRGLLYKDFKVVPYCPRCGTPLSSHEVAQGYENIFENSLYLRFRIKSKTDKWKNTSILSWTTTPWTLPGNVALAINPDAEYVRVPDPDRNGHWLILGYNNFKVLAEKGIFPKDYRNIKKSADVFSGKELLGIEYEPLFEVPELKSEKSYKVYPADFVSMEEGTGVVHTAVMYGEDDFSLGTKAGLPKFHTVTREGKFIQSLDYGLAGLGVKSKKADDLIVSYLRGKGFLFKEENYQHDYPFCWRCDTPLLYYADDSWFVKTTAVKKQLISNNRKINWVPSHIKEGRFGQWLEEVKDWAFSRERYWGTPLPIWRCEECERHTVIGSMRELDGMRLREQNRFFIMRHAQSHKNSGHEIISSKLEYDKYDLTVEGLKKTEEVAQKLKKEKIDFIFTSPFLRTKRTAEIISRELGLEVRVDERLKEFDHGSVYEGKDCADVLGEENPPQDFDKESSPDGESWNDVRKRMFDLVKELEEKFEGKNILIVSHGDPLWLLQGIAEGLTDNELLKIKAAKKKYIGTGEFRLIEFPNYPRDEFGNIDLHRPHVDEILLKCQECPGRMKRIPEVIDVWFDSGSMPFAQVHFPFACAQNKNSNNGQDYKRLVERCLDFPADYICEAVDQTRGWFYTLLTVATLLGLGPSFRNAVSLGHVLDKDGKKMSKSLGNVISPDYVLEKFGADVGRWWFYKVNQAGEPKRFREEELKDISNGFIRVIINSLRFWQLYGSEAQNIKSKTPDKNLLDRWLYSRLNSLIVSVTESLSRYDATASSREIERFLIDDLSNWWIRRSRDRFQLPLDEGELSKISSSLRFVLLEVSKIIAPFTPFLAEYLHEELHHKTKPTTISVHFHDWPKADKKMIDKNLEKQMDMARKVASLGLAARRQTDIKVRQPLGVLYIVNGNSKIEEELLELIKDEVNVKMVEPRNKESLSGNKNLVMVTENDISVALDTEITPALRAEGWVREFIRVIQDARKETGYKYDQKVRAFWFTEDKLLKDTLSREGGLIKQKTALKEFIESRHNPKFAYDIEEESELEPGRKIWLGLKD